MTHEELTCTPEYHTTRIQIELYNKVEQYIKDNNLNRSEFAKRLGVSKGYVSQVLNGDYDHRLSKLVELALFIGYKPRVIFEPIEQCKDNAEFINNGIIKNIHESLNSIGYNAMIYKPNYAKLNKDQREQEYMNLAI